MQQLEEVQNDLTQDESKWQVINQAIADPYDTASLMAEPVIAAYCTLSSRAGREKARALLIAAARKLRCATQMARILDAELRERRSEANSDLTYLTEFKPMPDDIEPLATGDFVADNKGISIMDDQGNNVLVCSHPIMPKRYLTDLNDDTQRVELTYYKGGEWRTALTTRRDISDRRRIIELSAQGIDVTSETAGYLVKYLATVEARNENVIAREDSCSRFGWVDGNRFAPYLDNMIYTGGDSYEDISKALHAKGDIKAWREIVRPFYERSGIPRIMLAASFAAPLLGRIGGLPFIVHLWGGTENGKTLSLLLAASVWGNPDRSAGLIHPFDATPVGMERLAECLHNLPVCLDELGVRSGGDSSIGQIIYMLTEGKGKPRGKPDGMRKTATWATVFLTTGEHPLNDYNSRAGTINRTISIPCGSVGNNIYSDPQGLLAGITANYGLAGKAVIDQIVKIPVDELKDMLDTHATILRCELTGRSTQKQLQAAAYLAMADELGQRAVFGDVIDNGSIKWLIDVLASEDDVSNLPRVLEWLEGWMISNGRHFATDTDSVEGCDTWGFLRKDSRWALVPTALRAAMEREGYSYEAFLSDAAAAGMIMTDGGRKTLPCRIGRSTVRCVVLATQTNGGDTVPKWRNLIKDYANA